MVAPTEGWNGCGGRGWMGGGVRGVDGRAYRELVDRSAGWGGGEGSAGQVTPSSLSTINYRVS